MLYIYICMVYYGLLVMLSAIKDVCCRQVQFTSHTVSDQRCMFCPQHTALITDSNR